MLSEVQIISKANNSVTESFSGIQNVKDRKVQWYEVNFQLTAAGISNVRELETFCDLLKGNFETFELSLGTRSQPFKRVRGNITADAAAAGSNKVVLNGLTGSFSSGDFVKFSNHSKMYRVLSYDTTRKEVTIFPDLRKKITLGDAVYYNDVKFTLRNKNDEFKFKYIDSDKLLEVDFKCREVLE